MNIDLVLAVIFYAALITFFVKHKKNVQMQGRIMALYRTKWGIKAMETIAKKFPKTLHHLGLVSIITGFMGMIFIFYFLVKGTFDLLFVAGAAPAVAPVLPGIRVVPGLPILSFMHWIIAILIIAVLHESCHGIYARLYNVKVKSSGFALFGPILAAFVEPDEKQLRKKSKRIQLSVFSAGPFANMVTGVVFIGVMMFITMPAFGAVFESDGVRVYEAVEGFPVEASGIDLPFVLEGVNGKEVTDFDSFANATKNIRPGDTIILETDGGSLEIVAGVNPENDSKGFMGVAQFELVRIPKAEIVEKYGAFLPPLVEWFHMLFFWLWVVSWGVGLFNLLPIGPVDGGLMLHTGLLAITKSEKKAKKYWSIATFTCLLLIFVNLAPYLWKLLLWILKPLLILFSLA